MTRNKLQAELLRIKEKENATVIFITHNIQEALVLGKSRDADVQKREIKIDIENKIPKPVTPASEGYGQMWKMFNDALWRRTTTISSFRGGKWKKPHLRKGHGRRR